RVVDLSGPLAAESTAREKQLPGSGFRSEGHRGAVNAVAVSPDGKYLATTGQDASMRVWETAERRLVLTRPLSAAGPGRAVSPDGPGAAVALLDGKVELLDLPRGDKQIFLDGHTGAAWGVSFSPGGRRLASVGDDGLVRFWEFPGGRQQRWLRG